MYDVDKLEYDLRCLPVVRYTSEHVVMRDTGIVIL